jgi:hypothetical protein
LKQSMIDGDRFTCPHTGFTVLKPATWAWMPGVWMQPEREAIVARTSEGQELLESGHAPVACFTRDHASDYHVNPTAQVFRRVVIGPADLDELARVLPETFAGMFHHCRMRDLTTDAILGGRRALRYVVEYTMTVGDSEEEPVGFRCRCIGHVVPVAGYALTLTIASSTAKRYRYDDDVARILGSAGFSRAGAPTRRLN